MHTFWLNFDVREKTPAGFQIVFLTLIFNLMLVFELLHSLQVISYPFKAFDIPLYFVCEHDCGVYFTRAT